jgi:DNA-binding transcriptional LysR family regulator
MPPDALADLDARAADIVVQPINDVPPRFTSAVLYEESFVIAMRKGHPLGPRPSLKRYAAAGPVLMSPAGDPYGNMDVELKAHGLTRRVAVTAPNFLCALEIVCETDLIAAVPRRQAEAYAARIPIDFARPPLPLGRANIRVIAAKAAMADEGVAWLFKLIEKSTGWPAPH